jgi:hypothetical protein
MVAADGLSKLSLVMVAADGRSSWSHLMVVADSIGWLQLMATQLMVAADGHR